MKKSKKKGKPEKRITPNDYAEHPEYKENNFIIQDEYLCHTERTLPTSYLYYERNKEQCPTCKYANYEKPRTDKGTGWYQCDLGLNSRIKRYCFNYKEKKVQNNKMINDL